MIFGKSRGAPVLKFFENVTLNQKLLYFARLHFGDFLGQSMGAVLLDGTFSGSSRFKELKNTNLFEFLMQHPYRSGSFQLGAEKGSKIEDFQKTSYFTYQNENTIFRPLLVELRA